MTSYSNLQSLLLTYDVQQNKERGYNAAAVEAAWAAVTAECARLGVSFSEGRRLASGAVATCKVEVQGPAHVLTDGNKVRQFATADEAAAGRADWQPVGYFVPAGESKSFSVAA